MEQFSLEKYLQDPTRKVVTRDGKDVRIICTDKEDYVVGRAVVVLIKNSTYEKLATCNKDGEILGGICEGDLVFAPRKQSRWVFLFRNRIGKVDVSYIHTNKSDAETDMNNSNGFALTEITWED